MASDDKHELREITDAQTLRALAHPVRIALYEELVIGGAMTATELGERIGETPTTCSFHLRQLAKYGFVEEAGGGKGRARPWRLTSFGMTIPEAEDTETAIASDLAVRLFRDRALARFQRWQDTKQAYPRKWREAAANSEYVLWVTAEELAQFNRELAEFMADRVQRTERLADPSKRPPGAIPVEALLLNYPIAPPEPEDD